MPEDNVVSRALICRCVHRRLISETALDVLRTRLRAAGVPVVEIDDLCGLAACGGVPLSRRFEEPGILVAACHERAVRWLLAGAGIESASARILNLREPVGDGWEAALDALDFRPGESPADTPRPATGDAWFPVLDRERCVDCGKCFDFCLFGAYERDPETGRVVVVRPDACKTNCPACARICPANAIIFPKSPDNAINGAALDAEALRGARIRLRPEEMLRGDVYGRLKARMAAARGNRNLFRPGVLPGERGGPPPTCPFAEPAEEPAPPDNPAAGKGGSG